MKKLRLSILLVLFAVSAKAQFYKFNFYTETYQEFNDGNVVIADLEEGITTYSFPQFNLFNSPVNTVWTVSNNGFMICNTNDFAFALDPCIAGMEKRDATTSITEKTEMVNGETVQKIQWKNMGLEGHDAGDFMNFQLWVYTSTQKVEFHYGPSNITSNTAFDDKKGPQIVVAKLTPDFQKVIEIYAVKGSGSNPEALINQFDLFTGVPAENLVMQFYNPTLSSVSKVASLPLKLYPNPATNLVSIKGDFTGNETLIIVNTTGQEVMRVEAIEDKRTFDIAKLETGVYFIKVVDVDTLHITKLVVNK